MIRQIFMKTGCKKDSTPVAGKTMIFQTVKEKTIGRVKSGLLSLIAISILLLSSLGDVSADQMECEGQATRVKAVTSPEVRGTNVAFNSNPGRFDPVPLLSTTVTVSGTTSSCLIAHFSAMAQPQDNYILFQVRVDGVPMEGHAAGFAGVATPVVYDPDETNLGLWRMVAYNFFKKVPPGEHLIEVYFAGCCSANPFGSGAAVESPVLTLEYR